MPQVPNNNVPLADPQTGMVSGEWRSFFAALSGPAGPAQVVRATASPFTYTASTSGTMVLNSSVNSLSLIRGRGPVALPVSPTLIPAQPSLIPMAAGDRLLVTYSGAAPSMTFLPS